MEQKITDRIKIIADNQGISIRSLEESINAANGTLQKSIQRGSDIGGKFLAKIVLEYNIDAHWLLTGIGNMYAQKSEQSRLDRLEKKLEELAEQLQPKKKKAI